ncbi:unnamed protein product [Arctogadus glacialis]
MHNVASDRASSGINPNLPTNANALLVAHEVKSMTYDPLGEGCVRRGLVHRGREERGGERGREEEEREAGRRIAAREWAEPERSGGGRRQAAGPAARALNLTDGEG